MFARAAGANKAIEPQRAGSSGAFNAASSRDRPKVAAGMKSIGVTSGNQDHEPWGVMRRQ
jgi:hypothetical protein